MTTQSPKHSVSVAAVILDDEMRVLVAQRRDTGNWEPPGGVLELDETIVAGLRREVREETGLEVEPEHLSGIYKHMTRGIVALVFRCRATGGQLAPTAEAKDFRWLSSDEIPTHMNEVFAIRIADALNSTGPAIRAHDGVRLIVEI